ncbi:alpha/beta hydrolase [Fulvivirgaceae bacterium BMA10]|uniref:Alpha/beta hydrolase n=1 Tax=Splendidivirga corallicola TaxID=3051826 RepID=A0ABT8KNM8_9BACT|nr:alpha/beta hydrolase [Fulvivirgaceae bacterium BMA10]
MKTLVLNSTIRFTALLILICSVVLTSGHAQQYETFKVEVKGKGIPMILIPGLNSSPEVWNETIEKYRSNFECHLVHLAGFAGLKPLSNTDDFTKRVRDDLIAYIKEEQLKKPVIMGHSLGGFLALWIGSKEPDLVGPLLIIDGLPFLPAIQMIGATPETTEPMAKGMMTQMQNQSAEQRAMYARQFLTTMITDESDLEKAVEWGKHSDPATSAQAMYDLYVTDLRNEIAKIKSPTLVLGAWIGFKDYGATRENTEPKYQNQFKKIPDHKIKFTDKGKHFIMWDDPDFFFYETNQFLDKYVDRNE